MNKKNNGRQRPFDFIFEQITSAQSERRHFDGFVPIALDGVTVSDRGSIYFGFEPEWVAHERHVALRAVNDIRAGRGAGPASEREVFDIETSASGHFDYTAKFALRCAELATAH